MLFGSAFGGMLGDAVSGPYNGVARKEYFSAIAPRYGDRPKDLDMAQLFLEILFDDHADEFREDTNWEALVFNQYGDPEERPSEVKYLNSGREKEENQQLAA